MDPQGAPQQEIHQLDELGKEIWESRYAIHPGETWEEGCHRISSAISAAEAGEKIPKWRERFYNELVTNRFIPGGRIIRGSGRPLQALLNCFSVGPDDIDSREGWGQTVKEVIIISGEGGGVGLNGSNIRPRNTLVSRTGGLATGAVSLFEIIDRAADVIRGGGGRRAALLLCLNHDHPDVPELLNKKLTLGQLERANISINFLNESPAVFFNKVRNDEDYPLLWQGKEVIRVKAKDIWYTLINNNLKNGEPGILNGWYANEMNNLWYARKLVVTNPCLTGDMRLLTTEGYKRFDELAGKTVSLINKNGNRSFGSVWLTGKKRTVEIRFAKGKGGEAKSVRCTPDHVFMLNTGEKCLAQDLLHKRVMPFFEMKEAPYVTSVREAGTENVYDFSELDTHWGVVEGVVVHNCGEIPMAEYNSCDLGAIVLPRFINRNNTNIRWDDLNDTITTAIRFLDNVLDVTHYPIRKLREEAMDTRRIGLGITGLHDTLLLMKLKYNSPEAREFVSQLMKFIKHKAYEASCFLAVEKGSFSLLDRDKFIRSGFCKTLKPSIRAKIKEYGIRNSYLLSVAPTGTISIISGVSSGLEPIFSPAYIRRFQDGENLKEETVFHPLFKKMLDAGEDISHFQGAYDLTPRDHLEMQKIVQQHLDQACSKTLNAPKDLDAKELSDTLMEYLPYLKGVTIYPSGSRPNEPLTPISVEEALRQSCPNGVCEL